jgi:hypothetical protein
MPRTCTICVRPDRAVIDEALVTGEPFRDVSACPEWRFTANAPATFLPQWRKPKVTATCTPASRW